MPPVATTGVNAVMVRFWVSAFAATCWVAASGGLTVREKVAVDEADRVAALRRQAAYTRRTVEVSRPPADAATGIEPVLRRRVRALLAEEGLSIDEPTWFVWAQRNTCNNEVMFFDEDLVPAASRPLRAFSVLTVLSFTSTRRSSAYCGPRGEKSPWKTSESSESPS